MKRRTQRSMSKGKVGTAGSIVNIAPKPKRGVTTFYKRDIRSGVACNRCRARFLPGEQGKQSSPGCYKHYPECPGGDA